MPANNAICTHLFGYRASPEVLLFMLWVLSISIELWNPYLEVCDVYPSKSEKKMTKTFFNCNQNFQQVIWWCQHFHTTQSLFLVEPWHFVIVWLFEVEKESEKVSFQVHMSVNGDFRYSVLQSYFSHLQLFYEMASDINELPTSKTTAQYLVHKSIWFIQEL